MSGNGGPEVQPETSVTYRPLGARVVAVVASGCLVGIMGVLWAAMAPDVRATFTPLQTATLVLFLAGVLAVLFGIARTRVRADAAGLSIRNGYRSHQLTWAEVVSISLPRGAPWAVIDAADGSVVAVMAVQGSDGERARTAVGELRTRVAAHSARDPDR